ncbi:MAG: hypothetical protein DRP64_09585, partial [Verrucomicrobia bacterium]
MYKKPSSLIIFTLALIMALAGNAAAARSWNDGDTGNSLWSDGDNWTTGSAPGSSDSTYIRIADLVGGGDGPVIQSGINAVCKSLSLEVNETGDTLTMVMTGGTLAVGSTTDTYFRLGAGGGPGTAALDMTGGDITVAGLLRIGSSYTAHLNLWNGTINTLNLEVSGGPVSYVDIRNSGALVIGSDVRSQIQGYVDAGAITAYGGDGEILINYSFIADETTVTATGSKTAYNPSPFDSEPGVAVDATLSWIAGDNTDSNDVYFGTDESSINNADAFSPEFVRNQTATHIAVADYHPSGPLELATTYYWRIDSVVDGTTTKGDVWSFTTDIFVGAGYSVPNPLIFEMKDCGVLKYNGEYYLIGTESDGDMRVSENLINWGQRTHVFSMDNDWANGEAGWDDEVHAPDLVYENGIFHLYWTLNNRDLGNISIGHAITVGTPLDPYTEPVTSQPFYTNAIDPQIFIDDDGSHYFYTANIGTVKVYGQPMSDPWTLTGSGSFLMMAVPGTWEKIDYDINEGQFTIKYRGTYYMLYNANTSSYDYNSFALGCAVETSGPSAFDNGDKYPEPVISSLASQGGHTITHPGQPTVLRGPNGFEWWVVYYARYDGSRKSIATDRVLFFDRRLHITGPSCNLASYTGLTYTPPPAAPTLGDLFNEGTSLGTHWEIKSGSWDVSGGEARQTLSSASDSAAIIKSAPSRNYLVEAGVKLTDPNPTGVKAGVTAYYENINNWLVVALDQGSGSWYYNKVEDGTSVVAGYPLPAGFDFNVYHTIRVTKNNTDFLVWIDERPAPGNPVVSTGFDGAGLPGLYTHTARASFDGFIYTIGWDEYDDEITGWGSADSGAAQTGTWSTGGSGIEATDDSATSRIYKGDLLSQYEFMTQVTRTSTVPVDSDPHTMGIYALYTDPGNWLIAAIDLAADKLKVYGRKNGISIADVEASVEPADSYNLRVIKRDDATRFFVDGELKITVPLHWGASQVGLRAEGVAARYNGITLFGLGSQYGDNPPVNDVMSDNFDDSIFSAKWQQVSIHADDITKHGHDTLPDIVINETNQRLQFSGCEQGFDSSPWYGRGLKYVDPIHGSSVAQFDFDSLLAYSHGSAARAAIGLRIWKDPDNWFEVRQTDDDWGDRLQTVTVNNGVKTTSSVVSSVSSGSLKIGFDNSTGLAEYFLNGSSKGMVNMSGMVDSAYYVYITAYTSGTDNRIACNVDNMSISSPSSPAASYVEWAA